MANRFEQLYQMIDYEQGITPWEVVEQAIQQDCTPWSDPRFIKGYYELLFACFQNTAHWLKGQYYAQLVLSQMPRGIDDDLMNTAQALNTGQLPQGDAWNVGNPFACLWPAPVSQYCYPWDGPMFCWTMAQKAHQRLARRLQLKASGYQSPRRGIYS